MASLDDSGFETMTKQQSSIVKENALPKITENMPHYSVNKPIFIDLCEKYQCIICSEVLRNAMQVPCGHHLCEECCVDDLFKGKDTVTCPVKEEECLEPFQKTEVFKDMCTRKEVMLLKVYCIYKDVGCKEIMPWRILEKHVAKCEYRPLPCTNEGCEDQILANQLEEHCQKTCQYLPVACTYCEQKVPVCELKKHQTETCEKYPVRCPNNCGVDEMPRNKIEVHSGMCPKAPRNCSYRKTGCSFQGLDKEVSEHERTATDLHLKQTIEFTNCQNEKTESEVVALTERVIKLERSIDNPPKKDIVERQERESTEEEKTIIQERMKRLQRAGSIGEVTSEVQASAEMATKMVQKEGQLAPHDVKLEELERRIQVLETANKESVMIWKIRDYTRLKQEAIAGRILSQYSQPFYTSRYGYKMCAKVYLNGDGMGKGTHLSLFFVVMRGEYDALLQWPFKLKVTLMLLDQQDGRRNVVDSFQPDFSSSFGRPTSEMNIASGCPLFVAHGVLETDTYRLDDTIFIKIKVTENPDRPLVGSDKLSN